MFDRKKSLTEQIYVELFNILKSKDEFDEIVISQLLELANANKLNSPNKVIEALKTKEVGKSETPST